MRHGAEPVTEQIPEEWKREPEFELSDALNSIDGPIIEVGGPTETGFEFADWSKVREAYVSNITPGAPTFNPDGSFSHYYGRVDFIADAQNLPFADGSIGAVKADSLPPDVFDNAVDESRRVLMDGGYLILQGISSDDVMFVSQNGFELKQYKLKDGEPYYAVFQKTN